MRLNSLSTPQRLAAGCGCVTVLAVVVAAITLGYFSRKIGGRFERDLAQAPVGWTDSLRALGRVPDLSDFLPPRDVPGDGSHVVHDTSNHWKQENFEGPYRALLNPAQPPAPGDSAAWRLIAADTGLDRFVRAARRQEWNATARVLGPENSVVRRNALAMPLPAYRDVRNVTRGLVIRGVMRLRRQDPEGALEDFQAAVGLGERLLTREPTGLGLFIGRAAISSGMRGFEIYARHQRDSALAQRAEAVRAWATGTPGRFTDLLIAAPESALALAADTTIALGSRAEALRNALAGWVVRPRGFLFGPPAWVEDRLDALARSPDRDFAALAAMTAATARRMHVFAIGKLMRESER